MVTNMKFYVLTIFSIFLALGIGIFIGFMFDAQEILLSQKEDIVGKLEERFEELREENMSMKKQVEIAMEENEKLYNFSRNIFPELVRDQLDGLRVSIIETNDTYIYSSVAQALEMAGAEVASIITIKDKFNNEENLKQIYFQLIGEEPKNGNMDTIINQLLGTAINGDDTNIIEILVSEGFIDIIGEYEEEIDYIVIAGGSEEKNDDRYNKVDRKIIDFSKKYNIPIVGIEKETVTYSYMSKYRDARISTVDNVDTIIGKTSLIMVMTGNPGNYGVKNGAQALMPDLSIVTFNQ